MPGRRCRAVSGPASSILLIPGSPISRKIYREISLDFRLPQGKDNGSLNYGTVINHFHVPFSPVCPRAVDTAQNRIAMKSEHADSGPFRVFALDACAASATNRSAHTQA